LAANEHDAVNRKLWCTDECVRHVDSPRFNKNLWLCPLVFVPLWGRPILDAASSAASSRRGWESHVNEREYRMVFFVFICSRSGSHPRNEVDRRTGELFRRIPPELGSDGERRQNGKQPGVRFAFVRDNPQATLFRQIHEVAGA
jgi:hypothetical protein